MLIVSNKVTSKKTMQLSFVSCHKIALFDEISRDVNNQNDQEDEVFL